MEGWVVEIKRNGVSKFHSILLGVMVYNPKLKKVLNVSKPSSLVFVAISGFEPSIFKHAEDGRFLIFEDKNEAKEFLELLKRFQTLNEILYWETFKTSEGFRHLELSLQKISAKKIMYADFNQIMESFDGFEEKMEKVAKKLAQSTEERTNGNNQHKKRR